MSRADGTQQLYNVLLLEGHTATPEQTYNGYLGEAKEGRYTYTRQQAIKKAQMFGGKIVPEENTYNAKIVSLHRHIGSGTHVKYEAYIEFNGLLGKLCKRCSLTELESYFNLSRKDVNLLLKEQGENEDNCIS